MHEMMIQLHIWPVFALLVLVILDIVVILVQKDDRKLKKYLRIQAIAWITLMSMVVFTGAAIMATLHLHFTVKILLMIAAAIALSFLELRRHLATKRAKPGEACFEKVRKKVLQYYIFELLWLLMIGALAPKLG
ncbi:hypothetical protein [Hydrogenimonas sp. SS33]|uniref:hypothetical protein n=1 Tax=Hydrogenimonas leucolamina TaxID=2954236 RepID=UPI00336BB307